MLLLSNAQTSSTVADTTTTTGTTCGASCLLVELSALVDQTSNSGLKKKLDEVLDAATTAVDAGDNQAALDHMTNFQDMVLNAQQLSTLETKILIDKSIEVINALS